MNYYSTPLYMQPAHYVNDTGIAVEESFSSVTVCDRILRRYTTVQKNEIIYNRDILSYVKNQHMGERRHIVNLFDAYFFPSCARPMYYLLGSKLGPQITAIACEISDIQAHLYCWPDDYDKSSSWMLSNLDKSYNQYKMHL